MQASPFDEVAFFWTDDERQPFDELVAWFNRRYPTPLERLQAARRLMAQWAGERARSP